MKLWLLKPIKKTGKDDPWNPWYDKAFGFVVRAETELQARGIANENAGDENRGEFLGEKISKTKQPWMDKRYSTCCELMQDGEEGLIMRDFASA